MTTFGTLPGGMVVVDSKGEKQLHTICVLSKCVPFFGV